MKAYLLIVSLVFCALPAVADDPPIDISLLDGSRIKGRIMAATASEVTVMSDIGVFRISLDKLTTESRVIVSQGNKPGTEALLARIAELEARVAQLQQENEQLRKHSLAEGGTGNRPSTPLGIASGPSKTGVGLQYSLSTTGKRHNSGCRYYGSSKSCGPTDGVPCKICGG